LQLYDFVNYYIMNIHICPNPITSAASHYQWMLCHYHIHTNYPMQSQPTLLPRSGSSAESQTLLNDTGKLLAILHTGHRQRLPVVSQAAKNQLLTRLHTGITDNTTSVRDKRLQKTQLTVTAMIPLHGMQQYNDDQNKTCNRFSIHNWKWGEISTGGSTMSWQFTPSFLSM